MQTMMVRLQVGIIAPDYPRYGISEGVACESSAKKCGRLTLEFVVNDLKVPMERIVIFGTSIGTGISSWLAKKVFEKDMRLGGLILQSPFTSIKAILKGISIFESQVANFFAQVGSTFIADRFTSMQCLKDVTVPLLVLHGADDDLIPVTHGKTIYEASKASLKKIVVFPNVGHNNFDWLLVIRKIGEFL
jgi:pimeloyl-ACP methyl ester carboxylesterase